MAHQAHPPIASASLDPRGVPQFLKGPPSNNAKVADQQSTSYPSASSSTSSHNHATSTMHNNKKRHQTGRPAPRNTLRGPPIPHLGRPASSNHRESSLQMSLEGLTPDTPQAIIYGICTLAIVGYASYHVYKVVVAGKQREKADRSAMELIEAEAEDKDKDKKLTEKGRERKGSTARRLSSSERDKDGSSEGGEGSSSRDRHVQREKSTHLSSTARQANWDHRDSSTSFQDHLDGESATNGWASGRAEHGRIRQRTSSNGSSSHDRGQGLSVDTTSNYDEASSLPALSASSVTPLDTITEIPGVGAIADTIRTTASPGEAATSVHVPVPHSGKKIKPSKERRKLERIASARDAPSSAEALDPLATPRKHQDTPSAQRKAGEEEQSEGGDDYSKAVEAGGVNDAPRREVQIQPASGAGGNLSADSSQKSWAEVKGKAKVSGHLPVRTSPIATSLTDGTGDELLSGLRRRSEDRLSSAASYTTQSEREENMSVTSEMSKSSSFSPIDGPFRLRQAKGRQASASSVPRRNVPGSAGWTRPSEMHSSDSPRDVEGSRVPEVSVTSPIEDKEPATIRSRQRTGGKDSSEYRALAAERDRLVADNTRLSSMLALSHNKQSQARLDAEESQNRARTMQSEVEKYESDIQAARKENMILTGQIQRLEEGKTREESSKRFNGNGNSNGSGNGNGGSRSRDAPLRGRGGPRGRIPSGGPGNEMNPWDFEIDSLRREVDRRAMDQQRREAEFQALMQQQAAQLVQALHQTAYLDQALRAERASHSATNGGAFPPSNGVGNGGPHYISSYPGHVDPLGGQQPYLQPMKQHSGPLSPQLMNGVQLASPWAALNMPSSPIPGRNIGIPGMSASGRPSQGDLSKHLALTVLKKRDDSPSEPAPSHATQVGEPQYATLRASATTHDFTAPTSPSAHRTATAPYAAGLTSSSSLPAGLAKVKRSATNGEVGSSQLLPAEEGGNDEDEDDTSVPLFASVHHDPAHIQALMIQAELERGERGRRASLRRESGGSSGTSNGQLSPAAQAAKRLHGSAMSRFETSGQSSELSPFGSRSASTATTAMSSVDGIESGSERRKAGNLMEQAGGAFGTLREQDEGVSPANSGPEQS